MRDFKIRLNTALAAQLLLRQMVDPLAAYQNRDETRSTSLAASLVIATAGVVQRLAARLAFLLAHLCSCAVGRGLCSVSVGSGGVSSLSSSWSGDSSGALPAGATPIGRPLLSNL